MSDDIRIKKAVYESVKDMFALAVSGSRFKLKNTSYEVQNAKTKISARFSYNCRVGMSPP